MSRRSRHRLHSPASALHRTQGSESPRGTTPRRPGRPAQSARPSSANLSRRVAAPGSNRVPSRAGRSGVRTVGAGAPLAHRRRSLALNIIWIGLFLLILIPMVKLQITEPKRFVDLARKQRIRSVSIKPERGDLVDRLGVPLAISEREWRIVADPKIIGASNTVDSTAQKLGQEFAIDLTYLREKMRLPKRYVPLINGVNEQSMLKIQTLNLPGISLEETPRRVYPAGDVARSVLGRVGRVDHTGISGLEKKFDSDLRGTEGTLLAERARWGKQIPAGERNVVPAKRGTTYVLTIDSALNYATDGMLAQAIANASAKGGTLVVADVKTGDVLALSSMRVSDTGEVRPSEDNQALVSVFEPGSTNKVITIAAALEEGVVGPYSEIKVPDRLTVADHRFKDDEPHATQLWTPGDILAESSNIGTIKIAQALSSKTLDSYLRGFGLGQKTSIDFPGESRGLLLPVNKWTGTSIGTVPIGQGLAVTSMQMLSVYTTIANGGERIPLRLIRGTVDANGREHTAEVGQSYRVVSKKTSDLVTKMLESVVAHGTGIKAQITGYSVAGKTGTAQKPNLKTRGYQKDAYVASFAGFFPSQNPRLAIIAVLDEPKSSIYGGAVAAPLFAEAALFAGQHYRIPPSSGSEVRVAGTDSASVSVKNAEMRAVEKAGSWQGATIRRAAIATHNRAVASTNSASTNSASTNSAPANTQTSTVPSSATPVGQASSTQTAAAQTATDQTATDQTAGASGSVVGPTVASAATVATPVTLASAATVAPPTLPPTTTTATIPDVSARGHEAPLPPRAIVVPTTRTPTTLASPTTTPGADATGSARTATGTQAVTAVE